MTRNQISFAELKETQRHNRVSERHEHQDVRSRSMQASAAMRQADSSAYQALTNWQKLEEEKRANLARELEMHRANVAQEGIQSQTAAAQTLNASIRERELFESQRSHMAQEGIQTTSLAETIRHNRVGESLNQQQIGVGYAQVAANRYATDVQAKTASNALAESIRNHKALEAVSTSQALSSRIQSEAARTSASTRMSELAIQQQQADAATMRAEAARTTAIAKAVDTGTDTAREIFRTIGGMFQ